jgi:hypothetical protein
MTFGQPVWRVPQQNLFLQLVKNLKEILDQMQIQIIFVSVKEIIIIINL